MRLSDKGFMTTSVGQASSDFVFRPVGYPGNKPDEPPHAELHSALQGLLGQGPVQFADYIRALDVAMPVTDESYPYVYNAIEKFEEASPTIVGDDDGRLLNFMHAIEAKDFNTRFREAFLEVAYQSGQGVTKKELGRFLSLAYQADVGPASERKLALMDSLELRDAVRGRRYENVNTRFARNSTRRLAEKIWSKEMSAAQAGSLFGRKF